MLVLFEYDFNFRRDHWPFSSRVKAKNLEFVVLSDASDCNKVLLKESLIILACCR